MEYLPLSLEELIDQKKIEISEAIKALVDILKQFH